MNSQFSEVSLALESGDRVLVYTEGMVEATNFDAEEYGTSRLAQALQAPHAQLGRY
ncbi:MAG TPA: SpoIIE family protein phosphatase [Terriglobales bacterium]|nr:SpoIIE family protein phosphatase [Terriglobales bacterium]